MSDPKSTFTKADAILMKLDKLNQQMNALEARVNAIKSTGASQGVNQSANQGVSQYAAQNANQYAALLARIEEQNREYKSEMRFLSAQIESVFDAMENMLEELGGKVAEKQTPVFDVDELSSRVAAKIIIPDTTSGIDADKVAHDISSRIVVPDAKVGGIDADKLARDISDKIRVPEVRLGETKTTLKPEIDYDTLGFTVAKYLYVPQVVAEQFDYDELAEKLAGKLPAQSAPRAEGAPLPAAAMDYDALGVSVAKNIYVPQAIAEDFDYDHLADVIAQKMPAAKVDEGAAVRAEVDYDLIARKVAAAVSVHEPVSPDYIAARVAEQIVIPAGTEIDIEELSRKVADKIAIPVPEPVARVDEDRLAYEISERLKGEETAEETPTAAIDEHVLAQEIAERLNFSLSDELIADAVVKNLAGAIDSDEIADCVAKRVGSISPEQFEITVDDDGCDSLAKSIESKLNYDVIAASVSEKLYPALLSRGESEVDVEELARQISEKIGSGESINEDALAEKAAAVLSNYLPEIDGDDIADKVVAGVLASLPAPEFDGDEISSKVVEGVMVALGENPVVDGDELAGKLTESVMAALEENPIVDGEAIADRVVEGVMSTLPDPLVDPEEISAKVNEESLSSKIVEGVMYALPDTPIVDTEIIAYRVVEDVVHAIEGSEFSTKLNEECEQRLDKMQADIDEIKAMLENGAVAVSETAAAEAVAEESDGEELVTVSELIGDEPAPAEEESEPAPAEEVIEEADVIEELDESPADGEILTDEDGEESGGVDFANMMKYNRSFIARIIQGTDDQKNYYGAVKTALLSYSKVNSNIAWGAERFNKGRETIARFKIRGKTLCLYLALDPKEFETSVYNHADVSDNKSMSGTPMMVKIKSPRGVKKAIRLIDIMLAQRDGVKRKVAERDYAAMYPYETIDELIEDGLVKDVRKNK